MTRLTIKTTGVAMLLSLEVDSPADFGSALGALLDRADELRPLLQALDGDADDDDDTDSDDTQPDQGPDDDGGTTADVDRLLSTAGHIRGLTALRLAALGWLPRAHVAFICGGGAGLALAVLIAPLSMLLGRRPRRASRAD